MKHKFFAFSQKVGHRILGLLLEFVPVYLLMRFAFGLDLVPANTYWAILSISLGFVMIVLVDYSIGITGFWLIRTQGVRRVFLLLRNVFAGALIPLTLFPEEISRKSC